MGLRDQPPFTQVMIDLETLDVKPSAVVVSIGAVRFNGREIGDDTFYRVLNTDDQQQVGRTVSPATVQWWAQQSAQARAVFDALDTPSQTALGDFADWLGPGNLQIWGNGSDFDNIIWGSLYDAFGMKRPWSYSNNRCYRTIKNILIPGGRSVMPTRQGVHHNALDDAIHQVRCLQIMMAYGGATWG